MLAARTHARTLKLAEFLSAWGRISSDGGGAGGFSSWETQGESERWGRGEREHIYSGRLHERPALWMAKITMLATGLFASQLLQIDNRSLCEGALTKVKDETFFVTLLRSALGCWPFRKGACSFRDLSSRPLVVARAMRKSLESWSSLFMPVSMFPWKFPADKWHGEWQVSPISRFRSTHVKSSSYAYETTCTHRICKIVFHLLINPLHYRHFS